MARVTMHLSIKLPWWYRPRIRTLAAWHTLDDDVSVDYWGVLPNVDDAKN
jgi:hypothetical protein